MTLSRSHTIDASDKILGRLAVEAALLLRGKDAPDFDPGRAPHVRVTVVHTDRIRVTGKKAGQKLYRRHSGYPGGLKEETYAHLFSRDSRAVLRQAVLGMLPKNRLRRRHMKNLILHKGAASERA